MTVEELVAKLSFRVSGTNEVKKFIKGLEDARKATEKLGKSNKINFTGGSTSGLGKVIRDFERATKAARAYRLEIEKASRASFRGGRGGPSGGRGIGGSGYGFNGYRPSVGRGRPPRRGGRNEGVGVADDALAGAGMGLGRATAVGVAAYSSGRVVSAATKSSMNFERSMIEVGKAFDISGAELVSFGNQIMEIAKKTGVNKEGIAQLTAAAGFGDVPKKDAMRFAEFGTMASQAFNMTPDATGDKLGGLRAIYGTDQAGTELIADAINKAADKSFSKESDLIEFLTRSGAGAKEAGIGAAQLLPFGAGLREAQVQPEVAATGINALLGLMKSGENFKKSASDGLEALGYKDSNKFRKNFLANPIKQIMELFDKLSALKLKDPLKAVDAADNLFGKEYGDDMSRLANQMKRVREIAAELDDPSKYKGDVQRQFDTRMGFDVSKVDRAEQYNDVLLKKGGDYTKAGLAYASEKFMAAVDAFSDIINKSAQPKTGAEMETSLRVANGLSPFTGENFESRFGNAAPSSAVASFRGIPKFTRQPKGRPTMSYPTAGGSMAPAFGSGTFGLSGAGASAKSAAWANQGVKETTTSNITNNTNVGNDQRTQSASVTVNATGLAEVAALVKSNVQAGLTSMGPSIVKANSIPTAGGTAASPSP